MRVRWLLRRDRGGGVSREEFLARGSTVASAPIGRIGRPSDVAAAILVLLSDEASYVDGGVVMD